MARLSHATGKHIAAVKHMAAAVDPVALETHRLVIATFALAVVTVLAIIVPLIAQALWNKARSAKSRDEICAILTILKERVDAIASKSEPGYNVGSGVSALCGRAFSPEAAGALPKSALKTVYSAVASATDAILAYVEMVQLNEVDPLYASSAEGPMAFMRGSMRIKNRQEHRKRISQAAAEASKMLDESLCLVKERN